MISQRRSDLTVPVVVGRGLHRRLDAPVEATPIPIG